MFPDFPYGAVLPPSMVFFNNGFPTYMHIYMLSPTYFMTVSPASSWVWSFLLVSVAAMTVWRIAGWSHLRAICALLSCDAQQRSGVAAGSPIAQLSDSPPDGGSARSLSGLLPRPGNSGKLSRHETTFGEEGEGGGTVGHTYKKIEYTKSDDLTNYIADLCGVF